MASISYFLLFGAILLLIGCVHCEFVGHGKHELDNGTIVQLNTNTRIAENDTDLEPYRNQSGACNVTMDKEGNINLWYTKNSGTTENGCSLDLVTRNESQISLKFGISHSGNLSRCLSRRANNMLSFAFSLKGDEFKEIKSGPKIGNESNCSKICKRNQGNCWKTTVFYSIGWIQNETHFAYVLQPVGEVLNPEYKVMKKNQNEQEAFFVLMIKEESFQFASNVKTFFNLSNVHCHKKENIRKHQDWKITYENFNSNNTNNEDFKSLFTFHIMPVEAMRSSVQNIWAKCKNDSKKEYCKKNATMLKCDKMFIRFDKEHFKILVPDTPTTEDGISKNVRNENFETSTAQNVDKTDNEDTKEVDTTQDMRLTTDTNATEASRISKITIFFIICAIIILLLVSIVGILIWILFRGDDKEEENKQLKPEPNQGRTKPEQSLLSKQSASTTTSNKDSYADIYLSANVSEDRFKNPTTVVETQYNQDFNEVDTVVDTQIEPNEYSNFKTGVKVSNTLMNTNTGVEVLNKDFTKSDRTVPDTLISTNTVHEDTDIPNTKTGIEGTVITNTSTGVEVPDSFYEE